MRWPLQGVSIVAATTCFELVTTFDRAPVVLARDDDRSTLLKVSYYDVRAGEAVGEALSETDLDDLIAAGEAMRVPEAPARPGVWLWVLGKACPRECDGLRDDLETASRRVGPAIDGGRDARAYLVDESRARGLLAAWTEQLGRAALGALGRRDFGRALPLAQTAFAMSPTFAVEPTALLAVAEAALEPPAATEIIEGYVGMARNSEGPELAAAVEAHIGVLRSVRPAPSSPRTLRRRGLASNSLAGIDEQKDAA